MKKIRYLIVCLLLMSIVFSVTGCSSGHSDDDSSGAVSTSGDASGNLEDNISSTPTNGTPENDTATGLKGLRSTPQGPLSLMSRRLW